MTADSLHFHDFRMFQFLAYQEPERDRLTMDEVMILYKHLTTHVARHTFATAVTLENDVPIETVSQMLGHKSIKTTQIYAKVTQRKMSNNIKRLEGKLSGITGISSGKSANLKNGCDC